MVIMNKFLKVCLLGLLTLAAYSCQQKPNTQVPQQSQTPSTSRPFWQVGNYVDEFGEPTGFKYVYAETKGRFSNTATNNSQLTVVVQPFEGVNIHGDTLGNVNIKLLEYGRNWVKGKGAMYISVKGNNGTIVKSQCYNDDRGETIIQTLKNNYEADSIFNLLLAGGKVMFSLETTKAPYSNYKFTIQNADGLNEALSLAEK